jgi:hypothetical protein
VVLGIFEAERAIRRDTSDPRIQVSYELARYVDDRLKPNETALVFAKPIPPELVQQYVDKVSRKSGDAGVKHARMILLSLETTPPDYQRTLVHSRLGKHRLRSLAGNIGAVPEDISLPGCVTLTAVWSDFAPTNSAEARLYRSMISDATPVKTVTAKTVSATVYRLHAPKDCSGL